MCGVGTFVVEAAALAARRAPGLDRTFAVEHFPETDLERMRELRARARAQIVPVEARLEGADRSGSAVLHAADHLKRIGLPGAAIFARRDAVETPPDDGEGLLILNPPWGLRQDVKTPLPQVVERLKAVRPRWRVVVVSPEERGKVLWTAGVGGLVVRAAVI
jgi:putative N6-adenine-specific DNA methylase